MTSNHDTMKIEPPVSKAGALKTKVIDERIPPDDPCYCASDYMTWDEAMAEGARKSRECRKRTGWGYY